MAVKKGYKQTEVGVIPEDWLIHGFNALACIPSGQVDPKQEPFRSMVLVAPDHIESGSGRLLKKETAAVQKAISGKYLFAPGDVLYSKIRPYLRKATIAEFAGLCSADMYPLRPSGRTCAGFLLGVILGHRFSKYAESVSVRSGMPKINRDELSTFYTAIPPTLTEQEAIAGALSDADAWIESLEQLIAKKRQIKQGAMQELLTGKRRLPGFSGKWKAKRLGELGSFYSGGTPNTSIPEYYGGDIAWITSSDCNSGCIRSVAGRLTPAGVANSATKWVVPGTVLMALYGATAGVVAISKIDATINQAVLAMKLDSQDSSFMFQKLSMMKDWIIQTYTQGGQPNLSGAIVKSVELESPAYDEQVAIATVLSDMDTEIGSLESKLAKAREIKQGMMQELLTGKIRLV
jgi:type I restriction enzyme S subunit